MHLLRLLPIALLPLLLLPACRPPEDLDAPPAREDGRDVSGDMQRHKDKKDKQGKPRGREEGGDDESRLSRNGLGKEDFALIQGELECVRTHFADDPKKVTLAEDAVYQRYGASEQWVERVRVHMKSEGKYRGKIEDSVATRQKQVCPDGKLTADMLNALDGLLKAEGGEGLLPRADKPGTTDAPVEKPGTTDTPADKPGTTDTPAEAPKTEGSTP